MGLTPLSGLPGATRAGDIDPSLIFHYTSEPLNRFSYNSVTTKEIHVTRVCFLTSFHFLFLHLRVYLGGGHPQ